MKAKKYKLVIHPNANKKLARFARQVKREYGQWSIREIARRRNVNPRYVLDNLVHGIEPPDTTEKGREVRVRLFMKERKPKPKEIKEVKPRKVIMPRWFKRTPEAEAWYVEKRLQIKGLSQDTREQTRRK
jgi:hypothetical protein